MTLAFDAPITTGSPLARLDPRWKLATVGVSALIFALLRTLPAIAASATVVVVTLIAARPSRTWLMGRMGLFAFFLGPFLLLMPLTQGHDGWRQMPIVGLRALALFGSTLVVLGTTPFPETLAAAQSLGVPPLVARLMMMSWRYVYLLADEFGRIRTALRSRGFRATPTRHGYRTVGNVVGAILVRGANRADRVADAMHCRGFEGRFRTLTSFRTRWHDVAFAATGASMAVVLLVWDSFLRS
jgi:cobalt/nickel transport system permease protein